MTTDKAAKPVFNNQAAIRILNRYINALSTVRDKVRADRHCPAGTAPESIHRIVDETVDSINEIVSALIEAVTALEGYKGVSDEQGNDSPAFVRSVPLNPTTTVVRGGRA